MFGVKLFVTFFVAGNVFILILIVVIFMCGDRSVLLCVVCFISGVVIRCVVSVN